MSCHILHLEWMESVNWLFFAAIMQSLGMSIRPRLHQILSTSSSALQMVSDFAISCVHRMLECFFSDHHSSMHLGTFCSQVLSFYIVCYHVNLTLKIHVWFWVPVGSSKTACEWYLHRHLCILINIYAQDAKKITLFCKSEINNCLCPKY